MPLRPVATTRAGPRVVSVGITHPVTKTARHIFRMERKAKTKANHDAEEDAVNMEAKGSTWQGLQPSTCSRFLKKLEMRSKSFMAGPREGRGKLGGRASIHCPRPISLSKGMRRWESNMVGSEQRLVEVGNDGVHAGVVGWQQQGANQRSGQNRSRIGSSTVTENAAKAKAARLGGQGGLEACPRRKCSRATRFQALKNCQVVRLQCILMERGWGDPTGVYKL